MKNLINLTIISIFSLIIGYETAYAAEAKGNADIYKITMRKIELCTGYTVVDFDDVGTADACHDAVVIGSGDKEVDIASVDPGSSVSSYGDPTSLPLGETYSHMRVTIDKKFKIRTKLDDEGKGIDTTGSDKTDNCITVATTDSQYVTDEATDKYTHKVAIAEGGTNAEMTMYSTNGAQSDEGTSGTYTQCLNGDCSQKNTNWYTHLAKDASELTSAIAMSTSRSSVSTDNMILVYQLTTPFTVTLIPPTIDISFGTKNAVGVQEVSNSQGSETPTNNDGMCSFYAEEPIVTITIK